MITSASIVYQRLRVERDKDVRELQATLSACPGYYQLTRAAPPAADEARRELAAIPAGHAGDAKHVYSIRYQGQPVGCVDLLKGYPDATVAFIGLLLIVEARQGQGFGGQALRFSESLASAWGCTRLRLAVVETNTRARAFWLQAGFTERFATLANEGGEPVVVMERSVGDVCAALEQFTITA